MSHLRRKRSNMVDNQHRLIEGQHDLDEDEIAQMNEIKGRGPDP
jgi:hypothetical protein